MTDAILTADPQFLDLALDDLNDYSKQLKERAVLADGIVAVSFSGNYAALGERVRQNRPIFLRHLCPATTTVQLTGTPDDTRILANTVRDEFCDELATGSTFSIQTRILAQNVEYKPFAVNRALSDTVARQTGAVLDVRNPRQIISCVIGEIKGRLAAFMGYSLADHNLSNWAGGERRYRREAERISRSEFKLLEAIEWFDISLPQSGEAVDLGAAPGGWTRILRQLSPQLRVLAVDPGDLNPALRSDHMVEHARLHADHFFNGLLGDEQFALIVNDMRMDARDSADMMLTYASQLAPDGQAIMTIKLPQNNPQYRLNTTVRILRNRYNVVGVKQLFHNRSEVTAYLRPS